MKLRFKIIVSFACVSILISAVGLVSNWYASSIQKRLLSSNVETTRLVQYTADIERGLYQSLVYLNTIRVDEGDLEVLTTINRPSNFQLTERFNRELDSIKLSIEMVNDLLDTSEITEIIKDAPDLEAFEERFQIYEVITRDWLELNEEDKEQASIVFQTSINPYFRNNIIPLISDLRQKSIDKQNQENDAIELGLKQANFVIRILTLVCVLISFLIAFYVYRSIAKPLAMLNRSARKVGEGDLDEKIEINQKDEIGELATSFNEMASNLQKRTLARDYLDSIIESIHEALIVTDAEGLLVGMNLSAQKMLHYTKDEAIGMHVSEFYDLKNMQKIYDKHGGKGKTFEFGLQTKRGRSIPVLLSESELVNANNEKVGNVVVATDISQRKRANEKIKQSLKEKEILLAEIHHRVKNNLAVISGLLQLQIYEAKSEKVSEALTESQARIQSIALVHEMLYHTDRLAFIDYRRYVNDLLQAISSMHLNVKKDISLIAEVEKISLNLNQAIPCSLLVNEIIVNSYKHAFVEKESGEIKVRMYEKEGFIELVIEDDGIGVKTDKKGKGNSLGLTLMNTLTNQLKGKFSIEGRDDKQGTRTTVIFPK